MPCCMQPPRQDMHGSQPDARRDTWWLVRSSSLSQCTLLALLRSKCQTQSILAYPGLPNLRVPSVGGKARGSSYGALLGWKMKAL